MELVEYEVRIEWDLPEGVVMKLRKRLKTHNRDQAIAEAAAYMGGRMAEAAKSGLLEAVDVTVVEHTSKKTQIIQGVANE